MSLTPQTVSPLSNPCWPILGGALILAGVVCQAWALYLVYDLLTRSDQSILLANFLATGPMLLKFPTGTIEIPATFSRLTCYGISIGFLAIISGIGKSILQAGVRLAAPEYQVFIKALRDTLASRK